MPSQDTHCLYLTPVAPDMHVDTAMVGLKNDTYLHSQMWTLFQLIPLLNYLFPLLQPLPSVSSMHAKS